MKREQVKEKHKWSIEDIFTSDEEWEKSFEKFFKVCGTAFGR